MPLSPQYIRYTPDQCGMQKGGVRGATFVTQTATTSGVSSLMASRGGSKPRTTNKDDMKWNSAHPGMGVDPEAPHVVVKADGAAATTLPLTESEGDGVTVTILFLIQGAQIPLVWFKPC